jgi:hypothetical protein
MQTVVNMSSKRVTGQEPENNLDSKASKAQSETAANCSKQMSEVPVEVQSDKTVAASEQVADVMAGADRLSID